MTPAERVAASRGAMHAALAAQSQADAHAPLPPAGVVLKLLNDLGDAKLRPTAARYPVALVLGSAVLGAVLVQTRPWRLLAVPVVAQALLAGVSALVKAKLP